MGKKIVYIFCFSHPNYIGLGIRGGDKVVQSFQQTLELKGFKCIHERGLEPRVKYILLADYVVFSMSAANKLIEICNLCALFNKKYIFFPFYEEVQWQPDCLLFLQQALEGLEQKFNLPDYSIYNQRNLEIRNSKIIKRAVYENALFNFVNSKHEALEIAKDYPGVVSEGALLSCGVVDNESYPYSDVFLKETGLQKGGFIIQIASVQSRKNQIASVLATLNLNIPLIFIFTEYCPAYFSALLEVIKERGKKGMVFFLTPLKVEVQSENIVLKSIDISNELLISAYQNAGLQLHPAFYECPGYTYLEAAKLAIPTVASSRSTLREYLFDENGNFAFDEGIDFVRPDDVEAITKSVKAMFGKKFKRPDLPIFRRTDKDVRDEMGLLIDRYML